MREKPVHLPMAFGEALLRIARTPRVAVLRVEEKAKRK